MINNLNPIGDAREAIRMMHDNMKGNYMADFSEYSACYSFSNENLKECYPMFNMYGKVLTVCGSGDQVISAVLNGAKEVDCFDSNILAYYNLKLKKYAIMSLDYEEFFFLYNLSNRTINRKKLYKKISEKIQEENVKCFWDYIFYTAPLYLNTEEVFPYFFKKRDEDMEETINRIPYLSEENFYRLKELLPKCNINFAKCDIYNVFKHYKSKYDFINFSNIYDYVGKNNQEKFKKFINYIKQNHLMRYGNIIINYSWNIANVNQDEFKSLNAEFKELQNTYYDGNKTGVVTYCRK